MKAFPPPLPRPRVVSQRGVMLLEVLIAMLIFSFGLLAVIGLQASAVKDSAQAQYRADATLLINDLIGRMYASNRTLVALQNNYRWTDPLQAKPAQLATWLTEASQRIPGLNTSASNTVMVEAGPGGGAQVTIKLEWKAPNEAADVSPHKVQVVTLVSP